MSYQKQVNIKPDAGMNGRLYDEPIKTFGARATTPVIVGNGVFSTAHEACSNAKGTGKFVGFAYNGMTVVNPNILAEATSQIPAGQVVGVLNIGSMWATIPTGAAVPAFGWYVFTKDTDGSLQFQVTTTPPAGYTLADGWRVVSLGDVTPAVGTNVVISNSIKMGA